MTFQELMALAYSREWRVGLLLRVLKKDNVGTLVHLVVYESLQDRKDDVALAGAKLRAPKRTLDEAADLIAAQLRQEQKL